MHGSELVVVLVAVRDVHVAVEQAGQQRRPGDVDRLVAVEPGTDIDDPTVLEGDIGVGDRRARAVEHATTGQDDPHALPFRWLTMKRRSLNPRR